MAPFAQERTVALKPRFFVRPAIEPPGSSGSARRRMMGCEDGDRVRPSRRIRCAPILTWRRGRVRVRDAYAMLAELA